MSHKPTILCVDQHQVLLDTLATLLPRFGFSAITAGSIDDAYAILASQPVDAILLDYSLCPGCPERLDGSGSATPDELACFAFRMRSVRPKAKVLVWCADGSCVKDPPPCANAVFLKPVAPDDLAAKLHAVLGW